MGLTRAYQYSAAKQAQEAAKATKVARKTAEQGLLSAKTLQTLLGRGGAIQNAVMSSLNLGSISKEWDELFAKPAMEAWWKYNAPGIREEYAGIPGGFYSTDRARGVEQAASQYMAQSVQPQLFSALQAARANMPSMIGALTNPLAALSGAGGGITPLQAPKEWTDATQGSMGSLIGGLAGMGLGLLVPGMGGLTTGLGFKAGQGALAGGTLGSMIGGIF